MSRNDLEGKLKLERVEVCLNRQRFTQGEEIGRYVECADFVEVEREKAMIVLSLDEMASIKM